MTISLQDMIARLNADPNLYCDPDFLRQLAVVTNITIRNIRFGTNPIYLRLQSHTSFMQEGDSKSVTLDSIMDCITSCKVFWIYSENGINYVFRIVNQTVYFIIINQDNYELKSMSTNDMKNHAEISVGFAIFMQGIRMHSNLITTLNAGSDYETVVQTSIDQLFQIS